MKTSDEVPIYCFDMVIARSEADKNLSMLQLINESGRLKRQNDALKTCNALLEKLLVAYRLRNYQDISSLLDHLRESKDLVQRLEGNDGDNKCDRPTKGTA